MAMKRSMVIVSCWLAGRVRESDEEQAQDAVCDARASIQKQVNKLSGLTPETATLASVDSLNAIRDDLGQIAEAQGDLNDERKQQSSPRTRIRLAAPVDRDESQLEPSRERARSSSRPP